MTPEFEMGRVVRVVLEHLERHREAVVGDETATAREVDKALESVRSAYVESELPPAYFSALETELRTTVPAAWRAVAAPFSALERRGFGRWRGGDLVARLAYVFGGLALGGLVVWLPFIPIWEKWVPFALAAGGWWLPDAQVAWHRRRYGRQLGEIVRTLAASQATLEGRVPMNELLPSNRESHE